MSNEGLSYATAALVVAAGSVFFSQNVIAGGDIIPPRDYEQPQRVQTWTPKRTWSGFYVGGGLGIQQFKSDVSVDSKNHFNKTATAQSCSTQQVTNTVIEQVTNTVTKEETTLVRRGCRYVRQTRIVSEEQTVNVPVTTTSNVQTCTCDTTTSEDDFDFSHTETVDSEWNAFGTVMIGLDRQLSSRVVGGIFANVDFGSSETDFGFTASAGPASADVSGNFKSDYSATIGARLGYLLNEKTLAYGLIGYTRTALSGSINASISHSDPDFKDLSMSKKFRENLGGITLGVGAERQITSNWSARLEYRYTWLGDLEAKLSGNANAVGADSLNCPAPEWTTDLNSETSVNFDPNLHSVRAVVTYKFNQ